MKKALYKISVRGQTIESTNQLFDDYLALFSNPRTSLQMRLGVGSVDSPFSQTISGPLFKNRPFNTVQNGSSVDHIWSSKITPSIPSGFKTVRGIELHQVFISEKKFDNEDDVSTVLLSRTILSSPIDVYGGEVIGLEYHLPSRLNVGALSNEFIDISSVAVLGTTPGIVYSLKPGFNFFTPADGENIQIHNGFDVSPLYTERLNINAATLDSSFLFDVFGASGKLVLADTGYGVLLFRLGDIGPDIQVTFDLTINRVGET